MAPQFHAGFTHLLVVVLSTQMPLVSLKVGVIQSRTLCSGEMTIPLFRLAFLHLLCTLMSLIMYVKCKQLPFVSMDLMYIINFHIYILMAAIAKKRRCHFWTCLKCLLWNGVYSGIG
ncbi:hypothetical protein PanWU01x14_230290, partial [Parasponia andersonii]